MSDTIVGACGHCGGTVTIPAVWMGVNPPTPTCRSCGARPKQNLPVFKMDPETTQSFPLPVDWRQERPR